MGLRSRPRLVASLSAFAVLALAAHGAAWRAPAGPPPQAPQTPRVGTPASKPQVRPNGQAVAVDPSIIVVDDGDTVVIRWPGGDVETVRILGIDSPETRHDEHNIPFDQPFGLEARAYAQGAFATATTVELVRASMLDPYERTLGYLILNGKNYSTLIVKARLAEESVTHYGDNGLPKQAAEVLAAAKAAGPLPFEPPYVFRKRMRILSESQKAAPGEPHP
ncbi:MAG: thermonuclease family protein [Paludisphaera borealis]|uniref:thermonuclease family protein n=1 Tax=Paludisphaera borealis TaxID=1387353 RepID=UPI00283B6E18|nr:thermonuclease family protein [Paludisphaera borealis]MDR3620815.1 thermonuclease family protein [Paludisphaera borealis]